MKILGIEKLTLIDYPGKLASIVFLGGCNFRCPFCYSSELVLPEKINNSLEITKDYFFNFLKEKKGLIDGLVICGGEPTIHKELPEFIKKIKDMGFLVKLDTNGSNPKMLENLIKQKLIDYVAMDIKSSLENQKLNIKYQNNKSKIKNKYEIATGVKVNLKDIERSVNILKKGLVDFEFRTTIVPTIHKKEDFLSIAKWIGGKEIKYYLQNFRAEKTIDKNFEKIRPFEEKEIEEIIKEISPYFKICKLR